MCIRDRNGPAAYVRYEKLSMPVGFISAIHGKFCGSCNRVRLTSRGFLKLCLCYENGVDLREVLQNGTAADLRDVMAQAILKKPMEHCFERPKDMTCLLYTSSAPRRISASRWYRATGAAATAARRY